MKSALSHRPARLSVVKINSYSQIMTKCSHDYPTMEESSAFIFHSSMKDLKDSIVGDTVLHEANSHERKSESHAVPGHGIGCSLTPDSRCTSAIVGAL